MPLWGQARKTLKYNVKQLTCKLKDLLRVEREKRPEKNTDKLKDSLEFVNTMMKFNELLSIMPEAGSESMGEERVQRITAIVNDLEEAETIFNQQGFLFVDELTLGNKNLDWENLFENSKVEAYKVGNGCDAVGSSFTQNIEAWTKLFVAMRIGELELNNSYQAAIHNDFFEHFTWRNFSKEELINCPNFILIADDSQLFNTELNNLSSLLSDNIPVKIIAVKRDNFGAIDDSKKIHTHTELAGLMLSHKKYLCVAIDINYSKIFISRI